MTFLTAVAALLLTANIASITAAASQETSWREQVIDALSNPGEVHLILLNEGEQDGFMRLGWFEQNGQIHVYDRTMMPSLEIYETMAATLSPASLAAADLSITFHQGAAWLDIDLAVDDEILTVTRTTRSPGAQDQVSEFSGAYDADHVLRGLSFIIPQLLAPELGRTLSYTWVAPLGGAIEEVRLTTTDGGVVETPGGSFETVKYELRGGTPENDIYVAMAPERRIVRIDVLGSPLRFVYPGDEN